MLTYFATIISQWLESTRNLSLDGPPIVACHKIIVHAVNTNQQHTTHKESPQKRDQSVV